MTQPQEGSNEPYKDDSTDNYCNTTQHLQKYCIQQSQETQEELETLCRTAKELLANRLSAQVERNEEGYRTANKSLTSVMKEVRMFMKRSLSQRLLAAMIFEGKRMELSSTEQIQFLYRQLQSGNEEMREIDVYTLACNAYAKIQDQIEDLQEIHMSLPVREVIQEARENVVEFLLPDFSDVDELLDAEIQMSMQELPILKKMILEHVQEFNEATEQDKERIRTSIYQCVGKQKSALTVILRDVILQHLVEEAKDDYDSSEMREVFAFLEARTKDLTSKQAEAWVNHSRETGGYIQNCLYLEGDLTEDDCFPSLALCMEEAVKHASSFFDKFTGLAEA